MSDDVLAQAIACCDAWEPQVRLIGNVQAVDLGNLLRELLARRNADQPAVVLQPGGRGLMVAPLPQPDTILVPIKATQDMLYAMAEQDGWVRGDRDHPMLTQWEDYWLAALAAVQSAKARAADPTPVCQHDLCKVPNTITVSRGAAKCDVCGGEWYGEFPLTTSDQQPPAP